MDRASLAVKLSDPIVRKAIYAAYNGQCFYTGRQVFLDTMHIDHVIPRSHGGGDTLDNLVLSCGMINLAKHAKTSPPFAEVVSEIVKLIFLPKVLCAMEEMFHNDMLATGLTCLNDRMRESGIDFRSPLWGRIRGRVTQRGKHKFVTVRHGKKIYYYTSDIDPIIDTAKEQAGI